MSAEMESRTKLQPQRRNQDLRDCSPAFSPRHLLLSICRFLNSSFSPFRLSLWLLRIGPFVLGACLFASLCTARQGLVETRDGHILEGHIRFESNLVVVANAAKELLAFVELTNLAEITFRKE